MGDARERIDLCGVWDFQFLEGARAEDVDPDALALTEKMLVPLGEYLSPPEANTPAEIRCDPHPRWNRQGTQVCFDSLHEGHRQVYVMDVSEVTV